VTARPATRETVFLGADWHVIRSMTPIENWARKGGPMSDSASAGRPAASGHEAHGPHHAEVLERAAHDLKNPLAVVRSALEWLAVELEGRDDALDAIRDATTAGERLVAIVDDLDSLARLERAASVATGTIDVAAIVGMATAASASRLAERGLTIVSSAPADARIPGDSGLITRAVHALVDACARGAPSGSSIEINVRVPGGAALPEIAQFVEIEIGQVGTSASAVATTAIDALASGGLGVVVAQRVARAHGGSLLVLPTETMPRVVLRLPR
jgi:signal transduction histidine kinase